MSRHSRSVKQAQIAARRAKVADLYLARYTQMQIAEKVGCDQVTVSRDLSALQKAWEKSGLMDIDAARRKELARIDVLEREYWESWRASKIDKTKKSATHLTNAQGQAQPVRSSLAVESRDGNAGYLAGVQWCIERRCKLLGLDAPLKQVTTVEGSMTWRQFVEQNAALPDDEGESEPADAHEPERA